MKQASPPMTINTIPTLSAAERNQRMDRLLDYMQRTKVRPKNTLSKAFHTLYHEAINSTIIDDQRKTDVILHILQANHYAVPEHVYYALMLFIKQHRGRDLSCKIAEFLYLRFNNISFNVLHLVIEWYTKLHDSQHVITIFEKNRETINNFTPPKLKAFLVPDVVKNYLAQHQVEKAQQLWSDTLKDCYQMTFEPETWLFLESSTNPHEKIEVLVTDPRWLDRADHYHGLLVLCACQEAILRYDKNFDGAKAVLEFCYAANKQEPFVVHSLTHLLQLYPKPIDIDAIKSIYDQYLVHEPYNINMMVNYLTFLYSFKQDVDANQKCHDFIQRYHGDDTDLQKIHILAAWFSANKQQGKQRFGELLLQNPDYPMMMYLAIRFAIKIRDTNWRDELLVKAGQTFRGHPDFMQMVSALSIANIITIVVENNYFFKPSDLVKSTLPQHHTGTQSVVLPDVVKRAFAQLEPISRQQKWLTVGLVGSAVILCLDFDMAKKQRQPYDIEKKLTDLDFAVVVEGAMVQSVPGFKQSDFYKNLFTRRVPNEPDIDLVFYTVNPAVGQEAYVLETIMESRDLTINMLFADQEGTVHDYTRKGLHAYQNRQLDMFHNAILCLQEDSARVLRVIKKLMQSDPAYQLAPSLDSAMRAFEPPNWFLDNDRCRKKFSALLFAPAGLKFIKLCVEYGVLRNTIPINPLDTVEAILERCIAYYIMYLDDNGDSSEALLKFDELTRQKELINECDDKQQQIQELKQELHKSTQKTKKKPNKSEHHAIETLKKQVVNLSALQDEQKEELSTARTRLYQQQSGLEEEIEWRKNISANMSTLFHTETWQPAELYRAPTPLTEGVRIVPTKWNMFEWNINKVRKVLDDTWVNSFSIFAFLHLGCWFSFKEPHPQLAWFYLRMAQLRLNNQPGWSALEELMQQAALGFTLKPLNSVDKLLPWQQQDLCAANKEMDLIDANDLPALESALLTEVHAEVDFTRYLSLLQSVMSHKLFTDEIRARLLDNLDKHMIYVKKNKKNKFCGYVKKMTLAGLFYEGDSQISLTYPNAMQQDDLKTMRESDSYDDKFIYCIQSAEIQMQSGQYDNVSTAIGLYQWILTALARAPNHEHGLFYAWASSRVAQLNECALHQATLSSRQANRLDQDLCCALLNHWLTCYGNTAIATPGPDHLNLKGLCP